MKIALVHDHFNIDHLEDVKTEMLKLGAPIIKAVWMECYDMYSALEGCHRIRAAKELGIEPIIEEVEYSDDIALDTEYTISEICDDSYRSTIIEF